MPEISVLRQYQNVNEPALQQLAVHISKDCVSGDAILLEGELGAGKTTFARAFIRARAGAATEVVSPTFMLLQDYDLPEGYHIWHYDLYRLEHDSELQELGLEDALAEGITLIEWPTLAKPWISKPLRVVIAHQQSERNVTLYGDKEHWHDRLPHETSL